MFPFQQNNELFSQISSDPHQDTDPNQIMLGQDPFQTSNYFTNFMEEEPQLPNYTHPNSSTFNDDLNAGISDEKKKIIRKEIERERRKQMSTLHASLLSLLPLQSLEGKRSMSDHINEAAKYIKHLQIKVENLRNKRDELKNSLDSNSKDEQRSSTNSIVSYVTVRPHMIGVEIVISSGSKEENFLLSRVVKGVIEEGFDVVSSISTKRGDTFYATIQCQASHLTGADMFTLQHRLNNVVLS